MAKNTKKKKESKKLMTPRKVEEQNIYKYCEYLMMIYGNNVNIARTIPDFRDGLKPVERRILVSMVKDLHMMPGNKVKVARIVGEVLGKYHPHGDSSVYESLVSLGQWWKNQLCLVAKDGNYGTVKGDKSAAARYIEGSVSNVAYENYFACWTNNITEFMLNYDGERMEPEYLPSLAPMVLMRGIFGMGYGNSTGIPYFNPNEVLDLTIELIKNPKKKNVVLIPDSTLGCQIVDTDWKEICDTGFGSFVYRGNSYIDDDGNIVITSIPHITTTAGIIESLADLMKAKKIDGIEDIVDKTEETEDSVDIKILVKVKKGFNPEQIQALIYKVTLLQHTFAVKMNVVYEFENYHFSLKSLLLNWIEFRRETKRRYYASTYNDARQTMHIHEALIKLLVKNDEKVINLIRKCKNRKEVTDMLISKFDLTDIQADAISGMRLYKLAKDDLGKFKDVLKEASKVEARVRNFLFDDDLIDKEIIQELKDFKKKYGVERKSQVIQLSSEDNIPNTEHIIIITKKGFIKKLDASNYVGAGEVSKDDAVLQVLHINNRKTMLLFDTEGKVYTLDVKDIPETGEGVGALMTNFIKTTKPIVSALEKKEAGEEGTYKEYYIFATKKGIVKKSLVSNYSGAISSGIIAILLKDGDKLVSVEHMKGDKDLIIYTKKGHYIKFNTSEISETLRQSMGVIGIKLKSADSVIGTSIVTKGKDSVVILTSKGNGKQCQVRNFDNFSRAGAGSILTPLDAKETIVDVGCYNKKDDIVVYTTSGTETVKVKDIPELIKMSKCKKVISVKRGEKIIGMI